MQLKSVYFILFSILLFASCSGKKENDRQEDLKMQQYMIAGKELYLNNCSACHQREGEGLAQLFPPLNKSDFMENNKEAVACIIRYGIDKPLTVNGVTYSQPMPGIPSLTNLEIAEIMTYIYNSWEHEEGLIGVKDVDQMMNNCK